ncbi:MAG: SUMF1/EgtB/PvdO family nonheme iron enzyme [Pseudomonadota bacterium]
MGLFIVSLAIICIALAGGCAIAVNTRDLTPHREPIVIGTSVLIGAIVLLGFFAYRPAAPMQTVAAGEKPAPATEPQSRAAEQPGAGRVSLRGPAYGAAPAMPSHDADARDVATGRPPNTPQPPAATEPDGAEINSAQKTAATTQAVDEGAIVATAATVRQPFDVFKDCDHCPELTVIPAGDNDIGVDEKSAGAVAHETPLAWVTFRRPFALGRYEVTREEFAAFVAATGHRADSACDTDGVGGMRAAFDNPAFEQDGGHPVVCVNYHDAAAYAAWLSSETGAQYALPSEAQWEYVRKAQTSVRAPSPFDDPETLAEAGNIKGDAWTAATVRVGSYHANPFLVFDMMGNAGEWTLDCWQSTHLHQSKDGSAVDAHGDCAAAAVRGGSWDEPATAARRTARRKLARATRDWRVGFRIMRALAPTEHSQRTE